MIKLSKYVVGGKPKDETTIVLLWPLVKTKENLYILLIPESEVEELKKGVIGEWD